jgi:Mg-chelatase subunit ChlD
MDISSFYTQIQEDAATTRSGGLILKGRTRNTRQPIHMILAVDTSGSMELEDKLPSVKKSIQLMLSFLSPEDRLSLVTFSDESKTFLSRVIPTPEERQAIQYRISNLKADGSTNMSAGLLEARGLVEPPSSGRKQGLILLTDGHANIGVHSEEGLLEILKRIQTESSGLSLTTVAYGVDHNSEMLTNMAKAGGGAYNVVSNLEDVATVFGDILGGLISVSAQKVELQLPPGATAYTSYRTETDPAGMTTVYVGDLYADAEITVLFKASPNQGPIRIKGTDMTTLDPIDVISTPLLLTDINAIPISLIMAEYRQKTITLLTTIRKTNGSIAGFQPQVEALIKQIQDDDRIRDHPLKPMLLEDLDQANTLARRGYLTQTETVEMAQHTTYLGISKGLRSITSHVPPAPHRVRGAGLQRQMAVNSLQYPDEELRSASPPPALPSRGAVTSPFANRMQTQIASVMRTMSQQPQDENSQT